MNTPGVAERYLMRVLLVAAAGLFISGLWLPMATIEQFFIFDNTISVASGLWTLATEGQLLLFILIVLFSVLLPLVKIAILARVLFARSGGDGKMAVWLNRMHSYSRWSMLDVFVVALMIVGVKLTVVADIETHLGLYLFTAGVLLIMALNGRVSHWQGTS